MATTRKTQSTKNQSGHKNPSTKKTAPTKKSPTTKKAVASGQRPKAPQFETNHEAIARTAYFIWEEKGCPHGHEEENWLEAEARLRHRAG